MGFTSNLVILGRQSRRAVDCVNDEDVTRKRFGTLRAGSIGSLGVLIRSANLASAIRALAPTSQPQSNARDRAATDVQNGLTLMAQASYANAVLKFLSAADELASITTTPVALARGQLASLIAEAEARQCVNP